MFRDNGGRCRRYPAGSMRSSGRCRWRRCLPTKTPRSKPRPSRRRCWRRAAPRRAAARCRRARSGERTVPLDATPPARSSNIAGGAGQFPAPVAAEPAPAGARAAASRIRRCRHGRAAVPRPRTDIPKMRPGPPAGIPRGDPDRAGARRSRHRRRARARRIRRTDQSACGPGRRLARLPVPLGELKRFRAKAGPGLDPGSGTGSRKENAPKKNSCALGRTRFSCKIGRCPISGARVFRPFLERAHGPPQ